MFRKLGAALGVATLTGVGVLAFSGTAWADALTGMTADAAPSKVMVGEPMTATITVTNNSATPITYGTIEIPAPFEDCRQEIGLLQPSEVATVTCIGIFDKPVRDRYSVTIANAAGEPIDTSAENGLHIWVEGTPVTPSESPSPSSPAPETSAPPRLPTTGASAGTVALVGAGMVALALLAIAGMAVKRRRTTW